MILLVLLAGTGAIFLLPTPSIALSDGQVLPMAPEAQRLAAVTFLMAGLWLTQIVPLAATSLLPLALFPLLGIQSARDVSRAFISDMQFLFIGGFTIALGLERWNVHRRVALHVVRCVGVRPRRLVLGMMLATGGLSMWISNTATTLMMTPIALALLQTIGDSSDTATDASGRNPADLLAVPLLLGIAWSASLGGMTTIIGTPTNTAAVAIYQRQLPDAPELTIAHWLIVTFPVGLLYIGMVWLLLTWPLRHSQAAGEDDLRRTLTERLKALGPIAPAEVRMLSIFGMVAVLWVFRRPVDLGTWHLPGGMAVPVRIPGWSDGLAWWFRLLGQSDRGASAIPADRFVTDSTVAVALAVLLFFIPSGIRDHDGRRVPLMDWSTAVKLPWEIILLFGGGLALAGAFDDDVTGLAGWLGQALQEPLMGKPGWLVIAVICLTMTFLTEVTSNVATISTVLPSLLIVSTQLGMDPRLVLIPATLATSCAFMLPIATAPNAIVFASGRVTAGQMARAGFLLNLAGVPLLTAAAFWYIGPLLGLNGTASGPGGPDRSAGVPAVRQFVQERAEQDALRAPAVLQPAVAGNGPFIGDAAVLYDQSAVMQGHRGADVNRQSHQQVSRSETGGL